MSKVTVHKGSFDSARYTSDGFKRIGKSERVVSLIAGTTLAGAAMRSRSLFSAALLLGTAAGLVHRGATGKCGFAKGMAKLNEYVNTENIGELVQTGYDKVSHTIDDVKTQIKDRRDAANHTKEKDEVYQASKDSFPASDPPSFTPVTGETGSNN